MTGLDASGAVFVTYTVEISAFENIVGVYQVVVTLEDKTTRRLDIIIQSTAQATGV